MSLVKKDIVSNISLKAHIPLDISRQVLGIFLELIKKESKIKKLKISNFGSFYYAHSPQRRGRNPKTKEEFIITSRSKLNFKTSNKIKILLN